MRTTQVLLLSISALLVPAFAQDLPPAHHLPVLDVSSMDKSVDPCVDFFTYSCGGWIRRNPIPPDQSSWSVYGKLQDQNQAQLRGILENAAGLPGEHPAYLQKIGDYYASCMDAKAVEGLGATALQAQLDAIEKLGSKDQLPDLAVNLVYQGALFRFRSDQDYGDSTQVIAEADQGGLGLPDRDYYVKEGAKAEELRQAYVAHVQKMFELLGDKPPVASREAKTVMRIETELARGSMTRVERRTPKNLYHKMTVEEFQRLSPEFSWHAYFTKVGLPELPSLNVETPAFFQKISNVIRKENLGAWKAYLRWHLVHGNARFLSSAFVNEDFNFFGKRMQ